MVDANTVAGAQAKEFQKGAKPFQDVFMDDANNFTPFIYPPTSQDVYGVDMSEVPQRSGKDSTLEGALCQLSTTSSKALARDKCQTFVGEKKSIFKSGNSISVHHRLSNPGSQL